MRILLRCFLCAFFLYEYRKNGSIGFRNMKLGDEMEIFEIKSELEEMTKTLDELGGSL